ncbi:hypothetical protein KEM55_002703, partial [Ascosphaera atra]
WGHSENCSFVPEPAKAKNTPTKGRSDIDVVLDILKSEWEAVEHDLMNLDSQLPQSLYVNWDVARTAPNELIDDCKEFIEYFELRDRLEAEIDECTNKVAAIVRAHTLARRALYPKDNRQQPFQPRDLAQQEHQQEHQ